MTSPRISKVAGDGKVLRMLQQAAVELVQFVHFLTSEHQPFDIYTALREPLLGTEIVCELVFLCRPVDSPGELKKMMFACVCASGGAD